jgi:hypothetical protein
MLRTLSAAVAPWLLISSFAVAQQQPTPTPTTKPIPSREELEKQFAESLSGSTLVGNFTVTGIKSDQPLKEDKYTLVKVSKLKNGDYWSFIARVQYGERDVQVPMALEVKWAGDTPVITLTDLAIPGLGTYTARVLFYRDQYAGTWSGTGHGGQMFGRIVKPGTEDKPAERTDKADK